MPEMVTGAIGTANVLPSLLKSDLYFRQVCKKPKKQKLPEGKVKVSKKRVRY